MITLLCVLILWKSSVFLRVSGYELVGEFQSINGLLNNSEVRYRGYRVGRVFNIVPNAKNIRVYFRVEDDVQITKGSSVRVIFDGLVGEKYLDIVPVPTEKKFYESGDVLSGYATSGIADFVDVGTQNLNELKQILKSFRDALASEEISSAMKETILRMDSITKNMDKLVYQMSKVTREVNLEKIGRNLEEISTRINESLDDRFSDRFETIQDNLLVFSEELRAMMKDDDFRSEVKSTVKEGRRVLKSSGDILGTIASIQLDSKLNYYYKTETPKSDYQADFDFWIGDSFLRLGIDNRSGEDKLGTIQQSIRIQDNLRARFGIFYTKPGVGIDYSYNQFTLSSDLYDFDSFKADIILRYSLFDYLDLVSGIDNVSHKDRVYRAGFSLFSSKKNAP